MKSLSEAYWARIKAKHGAKTMNAMAMATSMAAGDKPNFWKHSKAKGLSEARTQAEWDWAVALAATLEDKQVEKR